MSIRCYYCFNLVLDFQTMREKYRKIQIVKKDSMNLINLYVLSKVTFRIVSYFSVFYDCREV